MSYEEFMNKYDKEHSCCPKCGSKNFSSTLVGYIYNPEKPEEYKDRNSVKCFDCGWRGIRHDMVPAPVKMDKDTILEIYKHIQKRADDYRDKLNESYSIEREERYSECNTILAMLIGFLNNI